MWIYKKTFYFLTIEKKHFENGHFFVTCLQSPPISEFFFLFFCEKTLKIITFFFIINKKKWKKIAFSKRVLFSLRTRSSIKPLKENSDRGGGRAFFGERDEVSRFQVSV